MGPSRSYFPARPSPTRRGVSPRSVDPGRGASFIAGPGFAPTSQSENSSMEGKVIKTHVDDHVGYIEIVKGKANTYDIHMMREMDEALEELRFDDNARVLVLTSGVPGFFSAGADIEMLKGSQPDFKAMFCLHCQETLDKFARTPKLVIASINGHCVGGGLEIALSCDLRMMAKDSG